MHQNMHVQHKFSDYQLSLSHGQCSSARYCICSESGPPHPYRRRATKAPLFRACISPGGAKKQGGYGYT